MNCQELQDDIKKLQSLQQEMKDEYDKIMKSGRGKTLLDATSERVSEMSDRILEKYLGDFEINFPNMFGWKSEKSKISDYDTRCITSLSDHEFAALTENKLSFFTRTQDGKWEPSGEIDTPFRNYFVNVVQISDHEFMVDEYDYDKGYTYKIFTKTQDGKWELNGKIETSSREYNIYAAIISDHELFIEEYSNSGDYKKCMIYSKTQDGKWVQKEIMRGLDRRNTVERFYRLSDHDFAIVEKSNKKHSHIYKFFTELRDGKWNPCGEIETETKYPSPTIIPLSDHRFILRGSTYLGKENYITVYEAIKDREQHGWQGEEIELSDQEERRGINAITRFSDDQFAVLSGSTIRVISKTQGGWQSNEEFKVFDNNLVVGMTQLTDDQFIAFNEDMIRTISKTQDGWQPNGDTISPDEDGMIHKIIKISNDQFIAVLYKNSLAPESTVIFTKKTPNLQNLKHAIAEGQFNLIK